MSLVYRKATNAASFTHWFYDYYWEIASFAQRIDRKSLAVPLVLLKSVEWGIYRWYRTPVRRFYGVKGNELIYMITSRCCDRCAKCGIWKTPERDCDHLKVEHFINCLNRLHENLYQVTLTGGEPLVYSQDVLAIAEASRKVNVPMFVVTNGALLTEEFLARYSALGHTLVISLDTLDREKWTEFRGRNHYERVMANVELARAALGSRLRIQSVLATESRDDVAQVVDFCSGQGIPHSIQPYMDFGGTWHPTGPYRDTGAACAARKNICIYPNGDVVKCFDHERMPLARMPLGNIADEDIVEVLCRPRSTEVSRLMKTCNFPCKQLACNVPTEIQAS